MSYRLATTPTWWGIYHGHRLIQSGQDFEVLADIRKVFERRGCHLTQNAASPERVRRHHQNTCTARS